MTREHKRHNDGIQVAPGAVPLLGHVPRLVRDPLRWLLDCQQAGPIAQVRLGPRTGYLVCHPDLVHDMLVTKAASFDKGGPLFDNARELLGNGLATASQADHRRQRRLMQPAFTPPQIGDYAAFMAEESTALAMSWLPYHEVDIQADMSAVTMRVTIRSLLPNVDPHEADQFIAQIKILLAGAFIRTIVPYPLLHQLPTPANRRFNRARSQSWAAAERVVASAREHPASSGLLATLIASGAEAADEPFTDRDLRDQVMSMLIGGTETTAKTMAWLFHLLSLNPSVEARLHGELDGVLAGRTASPTDLPRLPFTRNVVLETLRMYPVAPLLTRVSITDTDLGGHQFPKGTDFYFSSYQLHHDANFFPDPERFDPDRWNAPTSESARHAYIPFSAGRRKCIGDTFAIAEATILLSAIVSRWRLRPAPGNRVRPRVRVTLAPAGLRLTAEPRP